MNRPLSVLALLLALAAGPLSASGPKAPVEKAAEKKEDLAARVKKLESELAECNQVKDALRQAAKDTVDMGTVIKQREVAEEEARRLAKELEDVRGKLAKAIGTPVAPVKPMVEASALQEAQTSLQTLQGSLAETQAAQKKLAGERDGLASRLQQTQEDLAVARNVLTENTKVMDAQKADIEGKVKIIEDQKVGFDVLMGTYTKTQDTLKTTQGTLDSTRKTLDDTEKDREHLKAIVENRLEGALVHLTPQIIPARPLNLKQSVPEKKTGLSTSIRGVIVVSCWIGTDGRVKAVRMIQPLSGVSYEIKELNDLYLDAAKRLIFEPATSADGKIRYQVWQGVGFFVDE